MSVSRLLPVETIRQITEASPIVEVIGSCLPLKKAGANFLALCPWHQEKTPSFNVNPARGTFKCFGCGAHGSVFDFVMLREGITFLPAVRWLADRAGISVAGGTASVGKAAGRASGPKLIIKRPEPVPFRLPADLHQGTSKELRAVADQRGLSLEGAALASERGLLRFGSPRGCLSWIVLDAERLNAQARRMDGGLWEHIGRKKAFTLPGSRASWLIGAPEAEAFPFVALVEGAPDLLAAHHFIAAEGRESDVAAVAVLGAANDIPEAALLLLANKRVRIYPHMDAAGAAAAVRWTAQLERVGCDVDAFSFEGLRRADGEPIADLNDLALVDVDDFEAERSELERILPQ